MPKIKAHTSISLDGYTAGPNQSEDNPLGEGGEDLHNWMFQLKSWRENHGEEGGITGESDTVVEEMNENMGAGIMGRNMFGPDRGDWGDSDWKGWWGDEPPYHSPVYVLTPHEREPIEMEGGTTFYFVTDGIESALEQAREAAGDKDIHVHGGASTVRQYLNLGVIDEITLNLSPILLGGGERLFEDLGDEPPQLELERVLTPPNVVHLTYSVKN
jgi:dihydrofolate reductase